MSLSKINYVDVITYTGTVRRIVVGTKNLECTSFTNSSLHNYRHLAARNS